MIAALRNEITGGRFQPNEHLVEADLANLLNTNRAIVRTALVVLEAEGLVIREPNRGARVKLLSAREALEVAEIRLPLETMSARLAALNATPEDCDALKQILADMQQHYAARNFRAMSLMNARLHASIATTTRNETLARILANLKHQLIRIQYGTGFIPNRPEKSLAEHKKIVLAICAGDQKLAARHMEEHLRSVLENLKLALNAV